MPDISWEEKNIEDELPPRKTIFEILRQKPIKLELGGGKKPSGGYINVDIKSEYPEVDYVADVSTLEEFPDGSVDAILARNVLHCFHRDEIVSVLRRWYRKLRKNSRMTLHLPDMKQIFEAYTQGRVCACWNASTKMADSSCEQCLGNSTMNYDKFQTYLYGRNREYEMLKSCYDLKDVVSLIERAGFTVTETETKDMRIVVTAKKLVKKE